MRVGREEITPGVWDAEQRVTYFAKLCQYVANLTIGDDFSTHALDRLISLARRISDGDLQTPTPF